VSARERERREREREERERREREKREREREKREREEREKRRERERERERERKAAGTFVVALVMMTCFYRKKMVFRSTEKNEQNTNTFFTFRSHVLIFPKVSQPEGFLKATTLYSF
jgi:hypothetical protein